ncbi:MAG: NAD(P)H-dependent glycerol-3-phosphate dehydrogenase [Bryobacteraceae bacterium]
MNPLAIVGGGSWGTALSIVLAPRFDRVRLWVYEPDLAERMRTSRENDIYLPGFRLPDHVEVHTDIAATAAGAPVILGVIPSAHARRMYERLRPHIAPSAILVSATKGLEAGTLLRMSQVIEQVFGDKRPQIAAISGPTFAREVAAGEPTALVVASSNPDTAQAVQTSLSGPTLRLYTSSDPTGVEAGGALKNVVAVGAGVCHGLGFGHNTLAALITRGLAEITRLAVAMGGQAKTLAGLAGLGDLVLTCTGGLSRNRMVGIELARGRSLADITRSMQMVAEGVETTQSAVELARQLGVEMPIAQQMEAMLHLGRSPSEAIRHLMERSLKGE